MNNNFNISININKNMKAQEVKKKKINGLQIKNQESVESVREI